MLGNKPLMLSSHERTELLEISSACGNYSSTQRHNSKFHKGHRALQAKKQENRLQLTALCNLLNSSGENVHTLPLRCYFLFVYLLIFFDSKLVKPSSKIQMLTLGFECFYLCSMFSLLSLKYQAHGGDFHH